MTTAQVVETSVTVNDNSPIQDYVNPDDQTQPTFEMTPGFKPFTWLSDVNNDVRKDANQKNKVRTYRKFKTIETYKCEDYLRQVTNVQHRITLTKLRLSNHNLAIETGRYVRPYKKPEERICPICKKDVEDERHFLTLCFAYQEKRSTLFEYLNKKYRISVHRMATDDVFLLLINPPSKKKPVQKLIAKYVIDCYEKRRSLVV